MAFSIGIITAERSSPMIREIDSVMREACGIEYLPYGATRQLADIYQRNAHRFDGLLFSGAFPYEYIVSHVAAVMKPHAHFELTDRDYYKMFARLLFRFPGIEIARVILDKPTTAMDFGDVFGGGGPLFFDASVGSSSMESIYELTFEQARRLWREKKIDRVVTRFSNLLDRFEREGIPCEFLFPSPSSMLETFHGLLAKVQSRALEDSMTAMGLVALPPSADAAVRNGLASFNESMGMALVIREEDSLFEVMTSNDVLKDITEGYTNCLLSGHLARECGVFAGLGWGVGRDLLQARQHAADALRESRRSPGRSAYLVNAEGEQIGPLARGRSVIVAGIPDAETEKIGRLLGISSANLQKLINLQDKRGTNRFSSAELAHYLNITPRSASRILIKLAENGGAEIVQSVRPSTRGRPIHIYKVDYHNLSFNTRNDKRHG